MDIVGPGGLLHFLVEDPEFKDECALPCALPRVPITTVRLSPPLGSTVGHRLPKQGFVLRYVVFTGEDEYAETERFVVRVLGRSNKPYILSILSYMHVIYENIHKRVFCCSRGYGFTIGCRRGTILP